MTSNLQVVDADRLVAHLATAEPMLVYGYSGTIPFNATDELDETTQIRLATRNAPVMYDFKTLELRFRLDVTENGDVTFMRAFDAENNLLAQMFPADYLPIPAVKGKIIRLVIPDVHFTLRGAVEVQEQFEME